MIDNDSFIITRGDNMSAVIYEKEGMTLAATIPVKRDRKFDKALILGEYFVLSFAKFIYRFSLKDFSISDGVDDEQYVLMMTKVDDDHFITGGAKGNITIIDINTLKILSQHHLSTAYHIF